MEADTPSLLANLRDYFKDPSQKTHKSLIDSLSALTIKLDQEAISVL